MCAAESHGKKSTAAATTFLRPASRRLSHFSLASFHTVTTEDLLNAVGSAINNATDMSSLASALNSIDSQAASLDALGEAAVLGLTSLAMSSAEYWSDNASAFEDEVEVTYAYCLSNSPPDCETQYPTSIVGLPRALLLKKPVDFTGLKLMAGADVGGFATIALRTWFLGPVAWETAAAAGAATSIVVGTGYLIHELMQ